MSGSGCFRRDNRPRQPFEEAAGPGSGIAKGLCESSSSITIQRCWKRLCARSASTSLSTPLPTRPTASTCCGRTNSTSSSPASDWKTGPGSSCSVRSPSAGRPRCACSPRTGSGCGCCRGSSRRLSCSRRFLIPSTRTSCSLPCRWRETLTRRTPTRRRFNTSCSVGTIPPSPNLSRRRHLHRPLRERSLLALRHERRLPPVQCALRIRSVGGRAQRLRPVEGR